MDQNAHSTYRWLTALVVVIDTAFSWYYGVPPQLDIWTLFLLATITDYVVWYTSVPEPTDSE